jgi:hypothetical protein
MPRSREHTGVCVLRITREPAGLVVHLTSRVDVNDASGEAHATVVGLDEGVAAVRRFLEDFRLECTPDPARLDLSWEPVDG